VGGAPSRAVVWMSAFGALHRAGLLPDGAFYSGCVDLVAEAPNLRVVVARTLAQLRDDVVIGVVSDQPLVPALRATIDADARAVEARAVRLDFAREPDTDLAHLLAEGDVDAATALVLRAGPSFEVSVNPLDAAAAGVDHALASFVWRVRGEARRMEDSARAAAARLESALEPPPGSIPPERLAMALDQVGVSLFLAADLAASRRAFAALAVAVESAQAKWRNRAHAMLAFLDALEGRIEAAEARLDGIRDGDWPLDWVRAPMTAPEYMARALALLSYGDAVAALEEMRLIEHLFAGYELWGSLHAVRIAAATHAQDDAALARFMGEFERHRGVRLPRTRISIDLADAIRAAGRRIDAPLLPEYAPGSAEANAVAAIVRARALAPGQRLSSAGADASTPLIHVIRLLAVFVTAADAERAALAGEIAAVADAYGIWAPLDLLAPAEMASLRLAAPPGRLRGPAAPTSAPGPAAS
jgi:hypothetical protein